MFKNYIKITLRNLFRQKLYAVITIFGLSIGMTCCLLIMLYVKQELSYDSHFPNADRVYRAALKTIRSQGASLSAASPAPLGPALAEDYPEIESVTRIYFDSEVLFEYGDKRLFEPNNVIYADPDFFKVFPFRIIRGDPSHLLDSPDAIVLTASMADKYFGGEDPVGKVLRVNNQSHFMVTGIVEDVPINTHYHFGFVISFLAKNEENFGTWLNLWTGVTNLYTYAVLPKDLDAEGFTRRVEDIITRHSGRRPGIERKIFFQPLKSIHLHSHLKAEIEANNHISSLLILATIAFLILIMACINYMNLATAQSSRRAKEVGIRKVLGALRFQLIKQFIGESILLTVLSLSLSLIFVEMLLPAFSALVGKSIKLGLGENLLFVAGFFVMVIFVGISSSLYPAFFLSRPQPVKTLKGLTTPVRGSRSQMFFKNALVVIQFSVSIILIVCTIIVNQQLYFTKTAPLGFAKEQTVVVPVYSESGRKQSEVIKNELLSSPGVTGASACLGTPIGSFTIITRAFPEGKSPEESFYLHHNFVDFDFIDQFNIEMVAGRKFSKEYSIDSGETFIINEAAVREWGYSSPEEVLGKRLRSGMDIEGTIIGVTRDYHISSFHDEIEPVALIHDPEYFYTMAVKIQSDDIPAALASIEKTMNKFVPEFPFTYTFLDDDINKGYAKEEQTARIIQTFSLIAIFLGCLGLFGLAAFAAERRTKEVGIRKVLGATASSILFLMSTEFSKWVLVSNIVAWPIAYYAMNKWLQGFAYRIDIGLFPFVAAAALAFMIAVLTVCYRAVKAAAANPVDSLRYE